jgi:class 3 adenylate cyclase/tetratricopeptide (TPR) repeat protein
VPLTCASCGRDNPDDARYCAACGASLGEVAPAGRKERKFATALFADLVGSTSLAEREDPEVVQSLVSRTFDRLSGEVERYGGLVEKFIGDAVLAVFGVPSSHEDDPERAVRAALEMQAVLSELNRGFGSEGRPQLSMRVGVEAGEVLVDLDRAAGTRDRMLTGDAVNTASRLQSAAEPGRVVVGPTTYAATKTVIDYRELPALALKGKSEPVAAWEALRVKARRRGERAPLGLEARLVGRDEELAVLKQTLQRVESEGRPALVTVLGPAGVGKSRLTWELLKYVEGLPQFVYWRKGRCLAYGGLSYSALAEAVKAQCEVLEDDPPEVVASKVDRAVEDLFGDLSVAPNVQALVGTAGDRAFSREDLFDAWRRFLERMAARYPLVLVLEDIHWADAGLLDFIDHLADWANGSIFVLTLARPELLDLRPNWGGGKRNYAAIYLDPLSPAENAAMLDDLLATSLPEDLKRLVIERSEGNPLFTEEIVRMLIDRGTLRATEAARWELARSVDEVDLPRSIHGLIAARLDTLPADEKAILQDAAVVGRVFWAGTMGRLSGWASPQVRDVLGRLRVKEIIVPREPPAFSDELEFGFRHVLIRDVAYESLPKSLRAAKHAEVAVWAEERAGARGEEIAEIIATHYAEALGYLVELGEPLERRADVERPAFHWAVAAGERAARLWQPVEAARWYRFALDLAERVGPPVAKRARLWEALANTIMYNEPYEQVARAQEQALAGYEELGLAADAGRVESQLAQSAFHSGRDQDVLPWVERALARLEPLGEGADLAWALHIFGWYHWRRGRLDVAEPPLRRSLEMAAKAKADVVLGHTTNTLGVVLLNTGRWREGLALVEESYEIARRAGDLHLLLRTYNNVPATLLENGPEPDYPRIEALLREGLDLARKSGRGSREAWILGSLSEALTDLGRLEEAEEYGVLAVERAREVAEPSLVGQRLSSLATIAVLRGRGEEAQARYAESERLLQENPEPQWEVWMPLIEAYLARADGDLGRGTASLLRGIDLLETYTSPGVAERLLAELALLLTGHGQRHRALPYARRLREEGSVRTLGTARADWVEGVTTEDGARAVDLLRGAATRFEGWGMRIDQARCLMDMAAAEARLGKDPRPTLERARDILVECEAVLFLREAEAALAALGA